MEILTSKEKAYLKEAVQFENLFVAKCSIYADQCQDEGLKAALFEMSKTKRNNANRLKQVLIQMSPTNYQ